jgi:hypothetical protein
MIGLRLNAQQFLQGFRLPLRDYVITQGRMTGGCAKFLATKTEDEIALMFIAWKELPDEFVIAICFTCHTALAERLSTFAMRLYSHEGEVAHLAS